MSGYSHSKIKRIIYYWLDQKPEERFNYENYKYILFDGTYFHKDGCLILIMEGIGQKIIFNQYVDRESYKSILPHLFKLKDKGLSPSYLSVDGHLAIMRAFKEVWPQLTIQRCLYHIQREGMRWLRSRPKTEAGKELRFLLSQLHKIKTEKDQDNYVNYYKSWLDRYENFVKTLPNSSVAFKDLKRTIVLINNGLKDMFHYLDDHKVDYTTNKLESFFSRLKADYRKHRGLSRDHKISYLKWYCYFKNHTK